MTYASLLEEEVIESHALVRIRPRRLATGFTLDSGSVYRMGFLYGRIIRLEENGIELTEGVSSSLSAGQWFYDDSVSGSETLYVRTSDSSNPSTKTLVVTYELYFSDTPVYWHQDPLDTATDSVYWEPIVVKLPQFKETTTDLIFGYIPIETSSLVLANADQIMNLHCWDSSFSKAEIEVYHYLSELTSSNLKKILTGFCSGLKWNPSEVEITVSSSFAIFNQSLTIPKSISTLSRFLQTGAGNLGGSKPCTVDPQRENMPHRVLLGSPQGIRLVNVTHDVTDATIANATTQPNRHWYVEARQSNSREISLSVTNTGSNTTTSTYVTSTDGINPGDMCWFDRAAGGDAYVEVTGVDHLNNLLTHSSIGSAMSSTSDRVKRSIFQKLYINQGGTLYEARYGRDWALNRDISDPDLDTAQTIVFYDALEANLGMGSTLSSEDIVYGRHYQSTVYDQTLDSTDLTSPSVNAIVYILKQVLGFEESELDTDSFLNLDPLLTEEISLPIPKDYGGATPLIQDILSDLLRCSFLKLALTDDRKLALKQVGPMGITTGLVQDDIDAGSLSFEHDYSDIVTQVNVRYRVTGIAEDLIGGLASSGLGYETYSAVREESLWLHQTERTIDHEILFNSFADAITYANRILYALSERRGILSFQTRRSKGTSVINDPIQIQAQRLPGSSFESGVNQSLDVVVTETEKSKDGCRYVFEDQLGIENNSSSW